MHYNLANLPYVKWQNIYSNENFFPEGYVTNELGVAHWCDLHMDTFTHARRPQVDMHHEGNNKTAIKIK